jgi:aerobic-type carbon monoxide dehydrogenase small subunit (CoxS/CutS family)
MMKGKGDSVDRKGLSRRSFLKGAGGVVGAVAVGTSAATAAGAAPPPGAAARKGIRLYPATGATITLRVNGQARKVNVIPSTTLLEVLREKMDLTGSKEVCSRGSCGACTVLLDGRSVNSCMTLAIDAIGAEITTVEGLEKDGRLDAVQAAFVENDACQCGYCIPGFVVRTRALLDESPKPSLHEIKKGLSGNICRCGAYVRIFEAAAQAARGG